MYFINIYHKYLGTPMKTWQKQHGESKNNFFLFNEYCKLDENNELYNENIEIAIKYDWKIRLHALKEYQKEEKEYEIYKEEIQKRKSLISKTAEQILDNIIEKANTTAFEKDKIDSILKIATAVVKAVPELELMSAEDKSEIDSPDSFNNQIKHQLLYNSKIRKTARHLLEQCDKNINKPSK